MFESNFPVDRFGATYTALWNAFKRITKAYAADEKTALYSGAAKRVYRLILNWTVTASACVPVATAVATGHVHADRHAGRPLLQG
jgi:hypothetical protein